MAMENYSPSHPTDEIDIDNSPNDIQILSESIGKSKFSEPIEQPRVFDLIDRSKVFEHFEIIKDSELNDKPKLHLKDRKSRSKSPEIRRVRSKSRSRSRSRKRRSRSRSRNRRSRSRNRTDRSFNRDRDFGRRSIERRSYSKERRSRSKERRSHSKERRSRSKERRSRSKERFSRSKERFSRSKERFSRSRERRSRSRERRSRSKERRSRSKERRSRSKDRKPRSNERRSRSRDRRSRSRHSSRYNSRSRDSPGQYRSKDKKNDNIFTKMNELNNKAVEPPVKQKWNYDSDEDSVSLKKVESMNVLEPLVRYDDMKPLANFTDNSNRNENVKPFIRRNEFNNRRGGNDQFRGFQRNRQWEPRNSGRSNFVPRNDQRFNRNNSGFNNDEEMPKWQTIKNDENSSQKMNWNDGKQDEDDFGAWGKVVEKKNSPIPNVESDKKGFAVDSDEEFGNWGKGSKSSINEMLTAANIESQKKGPKDESQDLPEIQNKFADNSDEEFGAWGNEQKIQKVINEPPQNRQENFNSKSQKTANDSDEEFGSWGKDRNTSRTSNTNQSNDNQGDSYNQSTQPFYSQGQRQNFNRNNDGNARFQGRRGANNNFNRFQRPNNQERFNNFNSNSSNFNNNPPNFNNNNSSFNNFNNTSNNILTQQPQKQSEILPQMPMPIPPYNFNPTQRPPQWPPINNLNFPPMCNGQMPFNPLQMVPQMQFSQMNQQPSISIPNIMQTMSYIPPPPPSTQPTGINNSQNSNNNFNQPTGINNSQNSSNSFNQPTGINNPQNSNNFNQPTGINNSQNSNNFSQPISQNNDNNLLETIMTNVGLSSKSIRLQPDIFKPQPPQSNKNSVNDSLHKIIKSAASTVLSRLVESSQKSNANNTTTGNISDSMSMSPPSPSSSPPPPAKQSFNSKTSESSDFILPPLPNYSDILKPSTNNNLPNITGGSSHSNSNNVQSSEISENKRNRSDFESKGDWQERIALEVKNFLRPAYMSKKITKSDYKEIMKRCVTKISRSGVTEINTEKIEKFVLSYVDKYQKFRRGKQHGVVSSSEHELVM